MPELVFSVAATDKAAQYDMQAKRLLGHKSILSQILVRTVDEFYGMAPAEVEACIEGDPIIGVVPTEPGLTNAAESTEDENGQRIRGFNTEQGEQYELHRLLTALLSMELSAKEKLKIISDEYGIPTQMDAGKETDDMCNLGQGVLELGFEKGIAQGLEQGRREMIISMHKAGLPITQIAGIAKLSEEEVQQILDSDSKQGDK